MAYLVAAVALVGLLSLLNLLLVVGVIRRLRAEAGRPPTPTAAGAHAPVPAGHRVGDFAAVTTCGEPVSAPPSVVAFLSPGCGPCDEVLPGLVAYAAAVPGGRDQVLAVIVGEPAEAAGMAERLAPVALVVREDPPGGPVVRAFGVDGVPALCLVGPDGRVLASGHAVGDLPVAAGV
jgi:hypothetical protein